MERSTFIQRLPVTPDAGILIHEELEKDGLGEYHPFEALIFRGTDDQFRLLKDALDNTRCTLFLDPCFPQVSTPTHDPRYAFINEMATIKSSPILFEEYRLTETNGQLVTPHRMIFLCWHEDFSPIERLSLGDEFIYQLNQKLPKVGLPSIPPRNSYKKFLKDN